MSVLSEQMEMTDRTCKQCGLTRPLTDFYKHPKGSLGRRARCKDCEKARTAEYREANRDKVRAAVAKWRVENYDRHREMTEAWKKANPERVRQHARTSAKRNSERRRNYRMLKVYGISIEQYEEMERRQCGLCAICERPPREGRRLAIDHCHSSGRVRDLLCEDCNRALGMFGEDSARMESAIAYVERWGTA